jgi:hypothetical protein
MSCSIYTTIVESCYFQWWFLVNSKTVPNFTSPQQGFIYNWPYDYVWPALNLSVEMHSRIKQAASSKELHLGSNACRMGNDSSCLNLLLHNSARSVVEHTIWEPDMSCCCSKLLHSVVVFRSILSDCKLISPRSNSDVTEEAAET